MSKNYVCFSLWYSLDMKLKKRKIDLSITFYKSVSDDTRHRLQIRLTDKKCIVKAIIDFRSITY